MFQLDSNAITIIKDAKDLNIPCGEGVISSTAEDLLIYAQMNMNEEKPYFLLCHMRHAKAGSMLPPFLQRH